jgi:glycosyltransferase involved in cell wall biosynthesis
MAVNPLLLVHGLPVGGTEVMVCQLARWLRGQGLRVSVGCLDELGELGRQLVAEDFAVEVYDRRPGFDVRLPLKIARTVRSLAIDVVHAHQYTPFFYGVLAKVVTRTPLIFTEHGRQHPDYPRLRRRAFNACFAPLANRVTTVSSAVRETLARVEGVPASRVEVIYNGIDVGRHPTRTARTKAEARARLGMPVGVPIVGTIGRLDPVKNYGLLLLAFRRLLAGLPEARLVVVGDGPDRPRLEALAADAGVAGAVQWLGQRGDIEQILPGFDVFALSSLSEGTPMTIIEAMAAGVPIVSTAVGGIPEMVEDGREALIVTGTPPEVSSVAEAEGSSYIHRYAAALERLLRDEPLAQALAHKAAARAHTQFSLERICGRYLSIYRELTGAKVSRYAEASRSRS